MSSTGYFLPPPTNLITFDRAGAGGDRSVANWGPSPLRSREAWKAMLASQVVSLQEVLSTFDDEASAMDALRYSFIKLTPVEVQKGPMPCQRVIDLP